MKLNSQDAPEKYCKMFNKAEKCIIYSGLGDFYNKCISTEGNKNLFKKESRECIKEICIRQLL